ncbi:MAG: peptidoglycan DD-metalloendopeptidase family protein [Lachnospiraceae bacterium]|nr:peptidoglycan DD-metalloendopeptidase family protein [Lachnospiraceae bacterium]
MKRNIRLLTFLLCGILFWTTPAIVYAASVDGTAESDEDDEEDEEEKKKKELKEELENSRNDLQNAQEERNTMQGTLSNIRQQKEKLEEAKNDLSDYVVELDGQLMSLQENLTELDIKIAEKEIEVDQIKLQLEKAEEDVENQYAAMKERIKFMYERGDASYLSMLFSSANLTDMLSKAEYIEKISKYDRNMLVRYEETQEAVAMLKDQLELEQANLQQAMEEATEKEDQMTDLIDQKQRQIANYETDINNKEQAIKEYEAEIAAQNATIAALEQKIYQIEQESVSGNDAAAPVYSGGTFCWPAPSYTRISDDYGNRIHPTLGVPQFHNGLDMAAPGGSPILAAEGGLVIAASYSSSMGNYIMIHHGGGLYTIYMHASALYVSAGQSVTRGQQIGAVGSTGRSTGNHLHFSVRLNGSYVNPRNYL